jgi:hypothetical protein
MRNAELASFGTGTTEMEVLYDRFDLDLLGRPTIGWENRSLRKWRPPEMLEHVFFPGFYFAKILVNKRLVGPLTRVYEEIGEQWSMEARRAHGLNGFVKCYCFGDGPAPNLFWYGAAWELSPQVGGETLSEVLKIFTRHGFTHGYSNDKTDKRKLRTLEYWWVVEEPKGVGAGNGKVALLTSLAQSGDNWVKFGIMVLIGVSGIGNWVNTKRTGEEVSRFSRTEAEEIKKEIHTIYTNQEGYAENVRLLGELHRMVYELKFRAEQREHPISSDQ